MYVNGQYRKLGTWRSWIEILWMGTVSLPNHNYASEICIVVVAADVLSAPSTLPKATNADVIENIRKLSPALLSETVNSLSTTSHSMPHSEKDDIQLSN